MNTGTNDASAAIACRAELAVGAEHRVEHGRQRDDRHAPRARRRSGPTSRRRRASARRARRAGSPSDGADDEADQRVRAGDQRGLPDRRAELDELLGDRRGARQQVVRDADDAHQELPQREPGEPDHDRARSTRRRRSVAGLQRADARHERSPVPEPAEGWSSLLPAGGGHGCSVERLAHGGDPVEERRRSRAALRRARHPSRIPSRSRR